VLTDIPTSAPYQLVTIRVRAPGYGAWRMHDAPLYPGSTRLLDVGLGDDAVSIQAGLPRALSGEPQEATDAPLPPALAQIGTTMPPATIRVARTGVKLCDDWVAQGRPVLYVEQVDFKEYVKNVLPNEWIARWHPEALRAGAMAAKHFAWYKILTQVRAPYGADVVDNTCDQYYVPNSQYASTNAAVDDTWNYVMHRGGELFNIHYLNSRARCETTTLQPCMPQEGTQEDALAGYSWQDMLYRYYAPDDIIRVGDDGGGTPDPVYSYAYVGQEPDTSDTPALVQEPRTLELRIRNTGTVSWYRENEAVCSLRLGTGTLASSDDPLRVLDHVSPFFQPGASGWIAGHRVAMVEQEVAPGQVATFRFDMALPAFVGTVQEYWTPVVEGGNCADIQWLSGTGMSFWLTLFPYRYSVVDHSPPDNAQHTQRAPFELVLRNEGHATWYQAVDTPGNTTGYAVHLATGNPADETGNPYAQPDHASPFYLPSSSEDTEDTGWWQGTDGHNRIVMREQAVPPGATATFRFTADVPPQIGRIKAAFTPVVEHLGWMEHQEGSTIVVTNNPYTAALTASSPPTDITLEPGAVQIYDLTYRNNGYVAWQQADTLLGTVGTTTDTGESPSPFAHPSWPRASRPARLNESSIAPDSEGRFRFIIQAPQEPGSYTLRLRPLLKTPETPDTWWMHQQTEPTAWNITVAAPPPAAARLSIEPAYTAVAAGQTFSVTIRASVAISQADTVAAHLRFDPTALDVVDAAGTLTTSVSLNSTLFPTATLNLVDQQNGSISILAARQHAPYLSGSFTVATVHFRARSSGMLSEIQFVPRGDLSNDLLRGGSSLNPAVSSGSVADTRQGSIKQHVYVPLLRR
jgi:hypothetical protein